MPIKPDVLMAKFDAILNIGIFSISCRQLGKRLRSIVCRLHLTQESKRTVAYVHDACITQPLHGSDIFTISRPMGYLAYLKLLIVLPQEH